MGTQFVAFRPDLQGPFASRFFREVRASIESGVVKDQCFVEVVTREVSWANDGRIGNASQLQRYKACWLILRDLQRIGWTITWRNNAVYLSLPDHTIHADGATQKQIIRDAMAYGRADRLQASREFLERMESPSPKPAGRISVRTLMADGRKLGRELKFIAEASDRETRVRLLKEAIRPYIQLVTDKARCEFSGYLLADIWRYFRFSWANPPEATPGRTMLYLIRDAGQPNHPVMGIFSLENSPIRIACRDDFLGWTVEAFSQRLVATTSMREVRALFKGLLTSLDEAAAGIDARGLCRPSEIKSPTLETLNRLADNAKAADTERRRATEEWHSQKADESSELDRSAFGNISKDAEEALYSHKRAEQLYWILFSKKEILSLLDGRLHRAAVNAFLDSEIGTRAVRYAMTIRKSRHIGTSILELNVCGAVPPYGHILAGKLAALLAISPKIVTDYRERYGARPSDIASRMKGKSVVRPAEVIYIGTTSLFSAGSSQYNRLRIPSAIFGSESPDIVWHLMGETEGFGTLHISPETRNTLRDLIQSEGVNLANSVFGEGASPKLRIIRAGVEAILQPGHSSTATAIAQHAMKRLVYGAWTVSNGREYLAGESCKPLYYFAQSGLEAIEGTQRIIDFWSDRWLAMRLDHAPALAGLSRFRPNEWSLVPDSASDEPEEVLNEA